MYTCAGSVCCPSDQHHLAARRDGPLEAVRARNPVQEFANQSDGTREASTLGYKLSADYVAGLMAAAGYEVTRQLFDYNFLEELAAPIVTGRRRGSRLPTLTVWTSRRWTTPAVAR